MLVGAQQERTEYGHNLMGQQVRIEKPNGVIQTTETNALGAITRVRQYAPDKSPYDLSDNPMISEFAYTMNDGGERTRLVEKFRMDVDQNPATPKVAQQTTYDWVYDEDGRLLSEIPKNGNGL